MISLDKMNYMKSELMNFFNILIKNFNNYFENHFIPSLNQQGINNIGVFKEVSEDLPRKIYVFIPYADIKSYHKARLLMASNANYSESIRIALSPVNKPIFNRYETSFYMAFDGMPKMVKPDDKNRFFELRTYESHSEDAYRRKVDMFNEGELELFDQLDFGSVFFGDKIAGERMPCFNLYASFRKLGGAQ